jgi:hypothetical protein
MLYVERDIKGAIVAIRKGGEQGSGQEPASLLDEEVLAFLKSTGEIEPLAHLLMHSDASIVRVLEDLLDLLIAKKVILFTELPSEAQEKIQNRKRLRAQIGDDHLMVDDIL